MMVRISTVLSGKSGISYLGGVVMRKVTAFAVGIIMLGFFAVTAGAAAESKKEISVDAAEQVIIDLLYQSTAAAVTAYYGEPTQFWRPEVLSIRNISDAQNHEVVIQVETFQGPHNPPYGQETITFLVDPTGQTQLVHYDHRDVQ